MNKFSKQRLERLDVKMILDGMLNNLKNLILIAWPNIEKNVLKYY